MRWMASVSGDITTVLETMRRSTEYGEGAATPGEREMLRTIERFCSQMIGPKEPSGMWVGLNAGVIDDGPDMRRVYVTFTTRRIS